MNRRTHLNLETLEGRSLLSGLSYSLTTDQSTYQPGQPVVMTFQETNVSGSVMSVDDGPSIDGFEVVQGGKLIWQSNAGINPMFIKVDPLQPGQSLTLTATWDGIPTGGSSPVTGSFTIRNQLSPQTVASATISPAATSPSGSPTSPTTTPQPIGVVTVPSPISISPPAGQQTTLQGRHQDPPAPAGSGASPVAISVSTNHPTYPVGHRVRMMLTLQNRGDHPISLPVGSAGGFSVFQGSTEVLHSVRVVSKAAHHHLRPGRSVKVTAIWDGKAHDPGVTLTAGTYTLIAHDGAYAGSATFQITS